MAGSLYVALRTVEGERKKAQIRLEEPIQRIMDIQRIAKGLLDSIPINSHVSQVDIVASNLRPPNSNQESLYETVVQTNDRIDLAIKNTNRKFGDFSLIPANLIGNIGYAGEKIAFGGTDYLG